MMLPAERSMADAYGCAPSGRQIPRRLAVPGGEARRDAPFRIIGEDLSPEREAAMAEVLSARKGLQCFAATRECMIFSLEGTAR